MKSNPNAVVTLTAGGLLVAGEQAIEKYASVHLPQFWSNVVIVAASTAVLWIGRDGVKGALARLVAAAKSIWTGAPAPQYFSPEAKPVGVFVTAPPAVPEPVPAPPEP